MKIILLDSYKLREFVSIRTALHETLNDLGRT